MPLKKIAKASHSSLTPLASSSQNALHATRKRRVKLRVTASGMLRRNATALAGLRRQREVEQREADSIGASPRVSRWYSARPRSPARYQPIKPTGR